MSVNKTVNAIIALIEGRPEVARGLLRSPELREADIGTLSGRLHSAIEKAKAQAAKEALREALKASMRLEPPSNEGAEAIQSWTEGVVEVEQILEGMVAACERVEKAK